MGVGVEGAVEGVEEGQVMGWGVEGLLRGLKGGS